MRALWNFHAQVGYSSIGESNEILMSTGGSDPLQSAEAQLQCCQVASSGSVANHVSEATSSGLECVRCVIIRSNILQVYPRKALLSLNRGLQSIQ